MPELPEVETIRRGLEPLLKGRRFDQIEVRNRRLRWPVPKDLSRLAGQRIASVSRRAKYLLIHTDSDVLMVHLGMSGSLRIASGNEPPGKHDHVDLGLKGGRLLRYQDPRRFGSMHFLLPDGSHPLLAGLGPEPLAGQFDGDYLYQRSRGRRVAIKNLIMDSRILVGVGNIYASESLFLAGIHPATQAGRISRVRCRKLAEAIREIISAAVRAGGTTLKDFVREDGRPGYFKQQLRVYGRKGDACEKCGRAIQAEVLGQRSSFFCANCQRKKGR